MLFQGQEVDEEVQIREEAVFRMVVGDLGLQRIMHW